MVDGLEYAEKHENDKHGANERHCNADARGRKVVSEEPERREGKLFRACKIDAPGEENGAKKSTKYGDKLKDWRRSFNVPHVQHHTARVKVTHVLTPPGRMARRLPLHHRNVDSISVGRQEERRVSRGGFRRPAARSNG